MVQVQLEPDKATHEVYKVRRSYPKSETRAM